MGKTEINFIKQECEALLHHGLIKEEAGPWAAPIVLVRK